MKQKNRFTKLIERLFGTSSISLNACSSGLIIDVSVSKSAKAIKNYVAAVGKDATYLTEPGKGELVGEEQLRTNTYLYIVHDFRDEARDYVNTGELYPGCSWNNLAGTVMVVQYYQKCKPSDPNASYSKSLQCFITSDGTLYEGLLLDAQGKFGFTINDSQRQGLADVIRKIGTENCVGDHPMIGDTAKLRGVLDDFVEMYCSKQGGN